MEDNEIIKALECIASKEDVFCKNCSYKHYRLTECHRQAVKDALDLINRQKAEKETMQSYIDCLKAEIERLEGLVTDSFTDKIMIPMMIEIAKVEAVKEFAERLKEYVESYDVTTGYKITIVNAVEEETIDNLVKEMVGEG